MTSQFPTRNEWLSLGVALVAVLALLHGGLVWGSQVLCGGDIVNQAHPHTEFWISTSWLAGWCPYSFSGRPYFADIQSALLYPPRWLFRAGLPVEYVTTYVCLGHSLFGAVGMYLLLRIRFQHLPGMLGAILWLAGGYTILRYSNGVVTLIYALAWVPWVWWAAELCGPRRWGMTALLALFAAMLFLAGSPQVVFITGVGLVVWVLGRVVEDEKTAKGRLLLAAHYMAAGIVALNVVFPQLVASAEYTAASVGRGGSALWEHLVGDSLGPWLLITNLAPEFFDAGNAEGIYWGSQSGFMETNAYIGVAPLMLALFGVIVIARDWGKLLAVERRWFLCLVILFVMGMIIAFGRFTPVYKVLFDVVPGFNLFRVPARWLLWPFACAIVLAAWGAELLLRFSSGDESHKRRLLSAWGITSVLFVLGTVLLLVFVEPVMRLCGFDPSLTTAEVAQYFQRTSRGAVSTAFGTAFIAACIGLATLWVRRLHGCGAIIFLLILTVLDLFRFWTPFREPLPHDEFSRQELPSEVVYHKIDAIAFREWFYPRTELIELLDSDPQGRYFYTDWLYSYMVDEFTREIYTERGMVHDLSNMRGYQPLQLESYARDFARIAGVSLDTPAAIGSFLFAPETQDREMLDAYNATRVLTYEATLGGDESRARLESLGLELEAAFPFRLEVWRNPHATGWAWFSTEEDWPGLDGRIENGNIDVLSREPGRMLLNVEVPEGGAWLHFSEVEYPGWEIRVRRADGEGDLLIESGRSIWFSEAGTHEVEHVFRLPAATRFTLPLSGLATILLLTFIGWRGVMGRRDPASQDPSPEI